MTVSPKARPDPVDHDLPGRLRKFLDHLLSTSATVTLLALQLLCLLYSSVLHPAKHLGKLMFLQGQRRGGGNALPHRFPHRLAGWWHCPSPPFPPHHRSTM